MIFLLLVPIATFLLILSDYEVEDGRVYAFVSCLFAAALLTPDAQSAVIVATTAILEFEATLFVIRQAHTYP